MGKCLRWAALVLVLVLGATQGHAKIRQDVLRRIAVFPVAIDEQYDDVGDDAWWKIREELTAKQRFLVASKNLMIKKDVFQARKELTPSDAIILSQLLDAQAVVTIFQNDSQIQMNFYDGKTGLPLYLKSIRIHPSLPLKVQLVQLASQLVKDFIAAIPYQGFVITDPLVGTAHFKKNGKTYAKVDFGLDSRVEVGDRAQFFDFYGTQFKPFFEDGGQIEVFAEGVVVQVEKEFSVVEISRMTSLADFKEGSLVRVPKEMQRLRDSYAIKDQLQAKVKPGESMANMRLAQEKEEEKKPLILSLAFLVNIAALVFLGF